LVLLVWLVVVVVDREQTARIVPRCTKGQIKAHRQRHAGRVALRALDRHKRRKRQLDRQPVAAVGGVKGRLVRALRRVLLVGRLDVELERLRAAGAARAQAQAVVTGEVEAELDGARAAEAAALDDEVAVPHGARAVVGRAQLARRRAAHDD
jgi:hypothetical protein